MNRSSNSTSKNEVTVTLLNLHIVACVNMPTFYFCAKPVSKASRRSARAYHLDIRGKFGEKEGRKSNDCSSPLTNWSMLFVARKNLCNIHFRASGKTWNLESGTGTVTATGVKWVTLKPVQRWNLSRHIISYQLLRHSQDIFKLENWLGKSKWNYYHYS